MKSIYLCNAEHNIKNVYSEETVKKLKADANIEEKIYNYQYIKAHNKEFSEVEYIFSTWGMPVLNEEEIKTIFPKLKCVFYAAGTVQEFAKPFLNCGVKIFSAWAANAVPVAEYTVAQIIIANKGFYKTFGPASKGDYSKAREMFLNFRGNYGAKIGIIGAGMIGRLVIEKLKACKFEILVYDPFLPDEKAAELGVEKVTLDRVFSECIFVSNHLADNPQTKNMLNGSLFMKLPQNATFLNTGRGAQVIEKELAEVLKKRKDITAVLDVLYPEPPRADNPLLGLDNCVITPHIAGSMGDEQRRMGEYMLEEFERYIQNVPNKYEVTFEMLKTMA